MPATQHQHHFEDLSPDDFERLIYWLVKRSGEFDEVQWYGGARDKGRDVVAHKHVPAEREKLYIQCKRYDHIAFPILRDELDKLAEVGLAMREAVEAVLSGRSTPQKAADDAAAGLRQ
jgi:hypothetical protein